MWKKDLIPVNKFSRPGIDRLSTSAIVIHFTEGPGQSAKKVRHFLSQRQSFGGYTFLMDENETLMLAGMNEMTPHVGGQMTPEGIRFFGPQQTHMGYSIQNWKSVSICYCHEDLVGTPPEFTYRKLVSLTALLMAEYKLPINSVLTHNQVTGKDCPRYFVKNPRAWSNFKKDVQEIMSMV